MKEIYMDLSIDILQNLLQTTKKNIIVLKFTAKWCNPCKRIHSLVETHFKEMPNNVLVFELDIDDNKNIELYSVFKSRRMINGIPAILVFYGNVVRDHWYVPDLTVNSSNVPAINNLFAHVKEAAHKL